MPHTQTDIQSQATGVNYRILFVFHADLLISPRRANKMGFYLFLMVQREKVLEEVRFQIYILECFIDKK